MRHQYHSRAVGDDQYIWDVKKLVERAIHMPIQEIDLSEIKELDEEYWFNADGSLPPTCRNIAAHFKLMRDSSLDYPIILCAQGRIMDGMHRVCKALALEHKTIKAVRFDATPEPDFKNMSLKDLPYDDDGKVLIS